jgi:hypothetical protein
MLTNEQFVRLFTIIKEIFKHTHVKLTESSQLNYYKNNIILSMIDGILSNKQVIHKIVDFLLNHYDHNCNTTIQNLLSDLTNFAKKEETVKTYPDSEFVLKIQVHKQHDIDGNLQVARDKIDVLYDYNKLVHSDTVVEIRNNHALFYLIKRLVYYKRTYDIRVLEHELIKNALRENITMINDLKTGLIDTIQIVNDNTSSLSSLLSQIKKRLTNIIPIEQIQKLIDSPVVARLIIFIKDFLNQIAKQNMKLSPDYKNNLLQYIDNSQLFNNLRLFIKARIIYNTTSLKDPILFESSGIAIICENIIMSLHSEILDPHPKRNFLLFVDDLKNMILKVTLKKNAKQLVNKYGWNLLNIIKIIKVDRVRKTLIKLVKNIDFWTNPKSIFSDKLFKGIGIVSFLANFTSLEKYNMKIFQFLRKLNVDNDIAKCLINIKNSKYPTSTEVLYDDSEDIEDIEDDIDFSVATVTTTTPEEKQPLKIQFNNHSDVIFDFEIGLSQICFIVHFNPSNYNPISSDLESLIMEVNREIENYLINKIGIIPKKIDRYYCEEISGNKYEMKLVATFTQFDTELVSILVNNNNSVSDGCSINRVYRSSILDGIIKILNDSGVLTDKDSIINYNFVPSRKITDAEVLIRLNQSDFDNGPHVNIFYFIHLLIELSSFRIERNMSVKTDMLSLTKELMNNDISISRMTTSLFRTIKSYYKNAYQIRSNMRMIFRYYNSDIPYVVFDDKITKVIGFIFDIFDRNNIDPLITIIPPLIDKLIQFNESSSLDLVPEDILTGGEQTSIQTGGGMEFGKVLRKLTEIGTKLHSGKEVEESETDEIANLINMFAIYDFTYINITQFLEQFGKIPDPKGNIVRDEILGGIDGRKSEYHEFFTKILDKYIATRGREIISRAEYQSQDRIIKIRLKRMGKLQELRVLETIGEEDKTFEEDEKETEEHGIDLILRDEPDNLEKFKLVLKVLMKMIFALVHKIKDKQYLKLIKNLVYLITNFKYYKIDGNKMIIKHYPSTESAEVTADINYDDFIIAKRLVYLLEYYTKLGDTRKVDNIKRKLLAIKVPNKMIQRIGDKPSKIYTGNVYLDGLDKYFYRTSINAIFKGGDYFDIYNNNYLVNKAMYEDSDYFEMYPKLVDFGSASITNISHIIEKYKTSGHYHPIYCLNSKTGEWEQTILHISNESLSFDFLEFTNDELYNFVKDGPVNVYLYPKKIAPTPNSAHAPIYPVDLSCPDSRKPDDCSLVKTSYSIFDYSDIDMSIDTVEQNIAVVHASRIREDILHSYVYVSVKRVWGYDSVAPKPTKTRASLLKYFTFNRIKPNTKDLIMIVNDSLTGKEYEFERSVLYGIRYADINTEEMPLFANFKLVMIQKNPATNPLRKRKEIQILFTGIEAIEFYTRIKKYSGVVNKAHDL